jgi:hypothetical protein
LACLPFLLISSLEISPLGYTASHMPSGHACSSTRIDRDPKPAAVIFDFVDPEVYANCVAALTKAASWLWISWKSPALPKSKLTFP